MQGAFEWAIAIIVENRNKGFSLTFNGKYF